MMYCRRCDDEHALPVSNTEAGTCLLTCPDWHLYIYMVNPMYEGTPDQANATAELEARVQHKLQDLGSP